MLIALEISFTICIGWLTFKKGSVSKSGLVALLLISGLFIGLQQIGFLIVLFSMFASSSLLSKFKSAQKIYLKQVVGVSGPRNATQAISNLGIAVAAFCCYYIFKHNGFIYAFLGSVASSNADTWASEIGSLSKKPPLLITNFKKVQKGLSGGITLLGTFSGVVGAFFISAVGIAVITIEGINLNLLFGVAFISGTAGFIVDSYLGALFQAKYKNKDSDALTEVKNSNLVKGYSWLNNNGVNFISSLFAAIFAFLLYAWAKK